MRPRVYGLCIGVALSLLATVARSHPRLTCYWWARVEPGQPRDVVSWLFIPAPLSNVIPSGLGTADADRRLRRLVARARLSSRGRVGQRQLREIIAVDSRYFRIEFVDHLPEIPDALTFSIVPGEPRIFIRGALGDAHTSLLHFELAPDHPGAELNLTRSKIGLTPAGTPLARADPLSALLILVGLVVVGVTTVVAARRYPPAVIAWGLPIGGAVAGLLAYFGARLDPPFVLASALFGLGYFITGGHPRARGVNTLAAVVIGVVAVCGLLGIINMIAVAPPSGSQT